MSSVEDIQVKELEFLSSICEPHYYRVSRSEGNVPMYKPQDVSFVNTTEFTKTAEFFKKNGVYTKAHPKYDRRDYNEFWDEEERRCREGLTLPGRLLDGAIQEVHITGEHYGYLNYGQIKLTADDNKYGTRDGELISRFARKTATKTVTFPDFWDGDFHYFNAKALARKLGLNLIVGKARRKGYSYKNGWIAANRANLYPRSVTVLGAYDSSSLYPEGTMQMSNEYLQFLSANTDWRKRRSRNAQDHIKFGYFLNDGSGIEYGFKSQILAVSFGPNQPGAARGKDSDLILIEEAGKCRNLFDVYKATQPTLEDGAYSTGIMIVFGTGGGDDALWEQFEKMFYQPDLYKAISFENEWEEGLDNTHCSFFVPQYRNLPGYIDEHGNSLIEEAKKYDEEEREYIKKTATDPTDYESHLMEYCWTPGEAFSRSTSNIFTASLISARLNKLLRDPMYKYIGREGILETVDGRMKLITNADLEAQGRISEVHKPVIDFPLKKSTDVTGCVVEWSPPHRLPNGSIPNIYRVWNDPFDKDKEQKELTLRNSLAATYVYEVPNNITPSRGDRIVAEYVGRPNTMDESNRVLFNIALYYGGHESMIMAENDAGDVHGYAKRYGLTYLLAEEPEVLWAKELQTKRTGRNFGISMNTNIKRKSKGAIYFRDWLFSPVGRNLSGETSLNLDYVNSIGLLRELLRWNLKGNFDRVSAMLVGMYDMKEVEIQEYVERMPENTNAMFSGKMF